MPIVKSIFWLSVAFVIIGPQIDYQGSVSSISNQAIDASQQLIVEQTDASKCDTFECVGTRLAVSAGVKAVGDFLSVPSLSNATMAQNAVSLSAPASIIPKPRARLNRS